MLSLGAMLMNSLGVDLFPDVTFPIVTITTGYPGAGPSEVETLISKVLEDEVGTLAGIKSVRSINKEGASVVVAEFTLETDVKYAEQQIRDRVGTAKRKLPDEVKEPVIRRLDPGDQPVLMASLTADVPQAKLYDLANEVIRPQLEQVGHVGLVEVWGGRKREIRVELDRRKLKKHELSATQVAKQIGAAGKNIPAGKVDDSKIETILRTLGEFKTVKEIESVIVNFMGNDVPVRVGDLGKVSDTVEDEKNRVFFNGKKSIFLVVYRQSGSNTIQVVTDVKKRIGKINKDIKTMPDGATAEIKVVRDTARFIQANVDDVRESIFIGIALTIIVVFFFLGNVRSTLITGLALPNSLLGAFILMALAGFTINVMTLLALSLAVGLLIDDAIVVRENIFRHNQMGKTPIQAAIDGTKEVTLAVVATTLTVIAVFGPIAFIKGIVGQFFKQFGLTVCFAMAVSLFDALTIAPMLSAYFAGKTHGFEGHNPFTKMIERAVSGFNRFYSRVEGLYEKTLLQTIKRPLATLGIAFVIFVVCMASIKFIPKTFMPEHDEGEFLVALDLPPGTSLDAVNELATKIDKLIHSNKEVVDTVLSVGNQDGESNYANYFVTLVSSKQRSMTTSKFKEMLRQQLKPYAYANPVVKDMDMVGGGMRPFNVNLIGEDYGELQGYADKVFARLKNHPALKDVEISYRTGKPEVQIQLDQSRAERLGISSVLLGSELRAQVEGVTPAVFRENGREYDVRVRLLPEQRDLKAGFNETYVPNINYSIIPLTSVAKPVVTKGPSNINRIDRGRYIQIMADIASEGPGLNAAMRDIDQLLTSGDLKMPPGVRYAYYGQAESFIELVVNMMIAAGLATLFIYLVLASLYESFVTPY